MSDNVSTSPEAQPNVTLPTELIAGPTATANTAQWPAPLRYGMGIVLISICVAGLLLILPLLQIILLSFLIAFIMFIPSRNLSRHTRLPYGLAVVVSFVIAIVIVVVLALMLLPEVWRVASNIKLTIQQGSAQLGVLAQDVTSTVPIAGVAVPVNDLVALLQQYLSYSAGDLLSGLAHLMFGAFSSVASVAAAVGTASVVALFFLIDLPISGGTMTNTIPAAYRREIALLFSKLDVLWLKFFRALIIIGVITAAASLGLFVLFGIEGALILAVVTATIGLIPVVGRIMTLIMIFAAALVNGSTRFIGMDNFAFAVLTIIAYLIVTQAIGTIVSPKLKGSAINVPTVAIVVGVLVGLATAGIVGALLITPIIGSLRVFMQYTLDKILQRDPYPGEELLPLQEEGFFSHMLYVKKKKDADVPGAA
ncbi:MAG TPA: AI-2E family transporter [Anaerolineae bacterium]|nr:AI-2E family transporter [Anaerolineae bacterium]